MLLLTVSIMYTSTALYIDHSLLIVFINDCEVFLSFLYKTLHLLPTTLLLHTPVVSNDNGNTQQHTVGKSKLYFRFLQSHNIKTIHFSLSMFYLNNPIQCVGGAVSCWLWPAELSNASGQRLSWHWLEPCGGRALPGFPTFCCFLQR